MEISLWHQCLRRLEAELPEQSFNTWIRPLQAIEDDGRLRLLAPNRYVVDWVNQNCAGRIGELIDELVPAPVPRVSVEIGSRRVALPVPSPVRKASTCPCRPRQPQPGPRPGRRRRFTTRTMGTRRAAPTRCRSLAAASIRISPSANFVEGKSNQLARAAAVQVAENPGRAYNPLFIYGGVGLGKTHLMHAVGNQIRMRNKDARVAYVHSERFVGDMVRALQHNTINEFKQAYRTLDALLIDDIQFFAGKERSQEEFFHTFNTLLEGQQQVILTCDRYPKEVDGLEERLKSRFGWGLTVAIEPPELETCVAILMSKASASGVRIAGRSSVFRREAHSLERARTRRRDAPRDREFAVHRAGRSRSISRRKRSRTCSPCRNAWSRSRTSRRPSRSITRSALPICCRVVAVVRSRGRDRWRWRCRKNSPITACRKSAMRSAAATTRRCCMRVA